MKHELTLYTQPNCMYCDMMKTKLDRWGYRYDIVNIRLDEKAKAYIKAEGHKTVPQLYYGETHINPNINTEQDTLNLLEEYIGYLDSVA